MKKTPNGAEKQNTKKAVGMGDFAAYRFLRHLAAGAAGVSFVARRANLNKNRYEDSLWLYTPKGLRRLWGEGTMRCYCWNAAGDGMLLARPAKRDKRLVAQMGLGGTDLYSLSLDGALRQLGTIPLQAEEMHTLPGGGLLLVAAYSRAHAAALDAAGGNREKAAARLKEEAACEVLDELPFWENGGGFASGVRRRVYLYDKEKLKPLSDAWTTIEQLRVAPDGGVWLLGQRYTGVAPVGNCLWRLDVATGKMQEFSLGGGFRYDFVVPLAAGGALVAGSDMREYGLNQNPAFYRLEEDGSSLLLYSGGAHSAQNSVNTDLAQPAAPQPTEQDGRVYFVNTMGASAQLAYVDAATGAIGQITQQPGAVAELVQHAGRWYFVAMRADAAPELYRLGQDGGEERLSFFSAPCQRRYAHAVPQPLAVPVAEGKSAVDGYVMLPPRQKRGQPCPGILCIHGGPKTVYGPVLLHEMQYLAAQGYALIFCNPPGSDGQGDAYADIRGRLGREDADAILRFLDEALRRHPEIDPACLGVMGGSYGGFMTNWLVSHTNRFAAAVSQRGIANWASMAATSDIGHYFVSYQAGASLWQQPEKLWEQSPLAHANRVKTPTLFIHSEEDYRCPMSEGVQMYAALREHGVPARLVLFRGENHELSRSGAPQHRLRRLAEIEGWFAKYLKGVQGGAKEG